MSDEPRKRSRFDQTEPEPARKSRFDRRSRSPAGHKDSESHRSRSPIRSDDRPGSEGGDKKSAAAAAAAAAAAKINASINAKKGIQHVDVPPIRAPQSPTSAGAAKSPSAPAQGGDIYQQDGDFIKDIEVNDLRNRYTLTKGSTQKMIKEKTGADVTTRGNYYPDKSMSTAASPPLYLHVTSTSKEGLEGAVKIIDELMQQELPDLVDQRRFQRGRREPEPNVERDSYGRRKWPEERIPVDLEPIPGFNLRAQVVGQGGQNVKYIQQETKCRVQIKGRGSGFLEQDTQMESDEQMYLHVAGPDPAMVQQAKDMALGLLETVRQNYTEFKENGPPQRQRHDRDQGYDNRGDRGGYHQRDRNGSGSYGGNGQPSGNGQDQYGYGYGGQQSQAQPAIVPFGNGAGYDPQTAAAAQAAGLDPAQVEQWSAYYMTNPSGDPMAAYGGYGYCMAYFVATGQYPTGPPQGQAGSPTQQQMPQGYGGYGQGQSPANGAQAPPPPPPPPDDDVPPPPPPPPGASGNGFNAVPPPPGM